MKAAKLVEVLETSREESDLIWALVESAGWRKVLDIMHEHVVNYGTQRDEEQFAARLKELSEAWARHVPKEEK